MQQLLRVSGAVVVCVLLSALCAGFTSATVYQLYPTNATSYWQNVVRNLQAGDVANFHAGTYTYSADFTASNLQGTSANPIEIRGADGETRPIWEQTNTGKNIFNIAGTYISMHDLELVGGSEGIRLGFLGTTNVPVTHSKFYNLAIHGTQGTGFTANFGGLEYVDLTLEHIEIYDTGSDTSEGFYLGCSGDGCRIRDSVIKNNYVHNNTMATGGSMAGIQVKTGSHNNIIQDNVCWYTKGPCVIVYDDYNRGKNQIIGNLVINNQDIGIQASAGVDIINNIVFNSGVAGIGIIANDLMPSSNCRNVVIKHNTIVNITDTGSSSVCMRLTGVTSTGGWVIANNAIYCPGTATCIKVGSNGGSPADDLTGVDVYNNVYFDGAVPNNIRAGGVTQSTGIYADMIDPSPFALNVYPTSGGALPGNGAGGSTYSVDYDFNGNSRSSTAPTIGAYEFSTAANPGPALGPGFKGSSSPTTTGSGSGGGGSSEASTFKAMWLKKLGLSHLM